MKTDQFTYKTQEILQESQQNALEKNQIKVYNYKYSFSSFSTFYIDEKLSLNTSIYYQLN
jgi:hypothetical protein